MFQYNVNLSIGEFHLVFGSLQGKMISNQKEMASLVKPDGLYDETITDSEQYEKLAKENREIKELIDRLYKETGDQLQS